MYPSQPYDTRSSGELKVFDALKRTSLSQNTVAFHSLNLIRHNTKRFGELDFVILGPEGLFALEVKGGRVSRDAEGWKYIDGDDRPHFHHEGPFKQVEEGLHGLAKTISDGLGPRAMDRFALGFGVVFPQCCFDARSAEWDPRTVADGSDMARFELWLKRMILYWRSKHDWLEGYAPTEEVLEVQALLRPSFEAIIPLHLHTTRVEEQVLRMTADQLRFVDVMEENRRVLCRGGAGTGKTFLASELAKRWTAAGARVMLVCKSLWLKQFLDARLGMPDLVVATVEGLPIEAKRTGFERFDALIVDEGQDLMSMNDLDLLDRHLMGGLLDGRWCIFHDVNNQRGLVGETDAEGWELLLESHPVRIPLTTNCRNTRAILEKVQEVTGCDMGTRGAGEGPEVTIRRFEGAMGAARELAAELSFLIREQEVAPSDITILSGVEFSDSCVSQLNSRSLKRIRVLDEYSLRSFPPEEISFACIKDFKGLENLHVIVVDLDEQGKSLRNRANLYVGMSRAKAYLCLIFPNHSP
jgi:hypothetical protein